MGLLDRLLGAPLTEAAGPAEPTVSLAEHAAVTNQLELLTESLGDLEQLAREDVGWRKLGLAQANEFTRPGLLTIQSACLVASIKSPLIKRGLGIRRNYVWGQGVQIAAREVTAEQGDTGINDLVQALLDSPEFERTLGSAQAREEREQDLGARGEFFVLAVHDAAARTVRPRLVPGAQIVDYITDPQDATDVWLYKREWTTRATDLVTGVQQTVRRVEWHPTLDYRPALRDRVTLIGGQPVRWDQPIQHCAVNTWTDDPWGLPDAYAAIDWARAYAEFLTQWAVLMRSLSRYAWRTTAPGSKAAAKARQAVAGGPTDPITGQPPVGGNAVMTTGATLEAIPKTGATIDAGSGKPLAGMVAAALDVPITMLLADPGVTGARATAETLDRPLELATGARQNVWADWIRALLGHVLLVAVDDGLLAGVVEQVGTRQRVVWPDGVDGTIDVTFPDVQPTTPLAALQALQAADSLGTIPPLIIVRLALEALGVEDVDEVLDDLTDENGNFRDPRIEAQARAVQREQDGAPGSQAAEAYR